MTTQRPGEKNMALVQILFSFQGRLRRTTYWLSTIGFSFVFVIVLGTAILMTGGLTKGPAGFYTPMLLPVWLLGVWVSLAIAAKRCHDRGYPAVMVLILFVPVIGGLWALIDLGFIDGTRGDNKYGPSPKALPQVAASAF
jgi:uncharacterized membrane protein YhaH (DUF805 family)